MARSVRYLPPFARSRVMHRPARPEAALAPVPAPPSVPAPKRARDEEGQFVGDDPATPAVNEAYEGGKPLKPEWDPKMKKDDLLAVALEMGLDVSADSTKKEIVAALEGASE